MQMITNGKTNLKIDSNAVYMMILNYFEHISQPINKQHYSYFKADEVEMNFLEFKKVEHHMPKFRETVKNGTFKNYLHSIKDEIE
jgi:hypothetical protein